MVYTEKTKKAMIIAELMHRGQYDKGGFPYIHHVMTVASGMTTEASTIVALMHDTVEDKRNIDLSGLSYDKEQEILKSLGLTLASSEAITRSLSECYADNDLKLAIDYICDLLDFDDEVRQAWKLVTHIKNDGKTYEEYVSVLAKNAVAKEVKLADLKHNMTQSRILDKQYPEKLIIRYNRALAILNES